MDSKTPLMKSRAARLVGALSLLAVVSHAWGQSGTIPAYIDSLGDFEVAQLDGALAPTNGKVSMESVTPSEWLNNDPSSLGLSAVIIAWSGGAKSTGGSTLFVHGGGHSDGANNGMYAYDFAGGAKPTGWQSPLVISPLSAVLSTSKTYSDGFPTSVHTYDGVVYANHNNTIYRFRGSIYGAGDQTTASFKFNVATKTWTRLPDVPSNGGYAAVTFYDPVSRNIFVSGIQDLTGYFFRTSNDTWSSAKSFNGNGAGEAAAAWDPTRGRGLLVADSARRALFTLNFSAETVSVSSITLSGATEVLKAGVSVVYDPGRDVYWLFGGPGTSSGWNTIYEVPAGGPWNIVAHTLSGPAIQHENGMVGSYGRFVLMDQWRAIGIVGKTDAPAYVIKLPAANVNSVKPKPPASLTAN